MGGGTPTRVLSVDDDGSLGYRVEELLRTERDLYYAGHSTAATLLSIVAGVQPEVVAMDVTGAGKSVSDGARREALAAVLDHFPALQFILLYDATQPDIEAQACRMTGKAATLVPGDAPPDELLKALRSAARRGEKP